MLEDVPADTVGTRCKSEVLLEGLEVDLGVKGGGFGFHIYMSCKLVILGMMTEKSNSRESFIEK